MSGKYYVWAGGRWRELDICVWSRHFSFVYVRDGELRVTSRRRVLAALMALGEGRPGPAGLGPTLPLLRCTKNNMGTLRAASAPPGPVVASNPPLTINFVTTEQQTEAPPVNNNCELTDLTQRTSAKKTRSPSTAQSKVKDKRDKVLTISETDVIALRSHLARTRRDALARFDADEDYKRALFYAINPSVDVYRCSRTERAMRERRRDGLPHFAARLGLTPTPTPTRTLEHQHSPPRPSSSRRPLRPRPSVRYRKKNSSSSDKADKESELARKQSLRRRPPRPTDSGDEGSTDSSIILQTKTIARSTPSRGRREPLSQHRTAKPYNHVSESGSETFQKTRATQSKAVPNPSRSSSSNASEHISEPSSHSSKDNENNNKIDENKRNSLRRSTVTQRKLSLEKAGNEKHVEKQHTVTRSARKDTKQTDKEDKSRSKLVNGLPLRSSSRVVPERASKRTVPSSSDEEDPERVNRPVMRKPRVISSNTSTASSLVRKVPHPGQSHVISKRASGHHVREYSNLGDHAIVASVSTGTRARRVNGNQLRREPEKQKTGRRSLRASESEDVPSDVSEESTVLPLPRFNPCVLLQRVSGERDNQRERQIDEQRPLADEETGRRSLRASESEDVPSDVSEESTVLPLPRFNPCVLLRRVSGERDNQRERQIDEQRPLADEETGRRSLRASESEDVPSDVSEESTVLPLPRFNPCVLLRRVSGERDNQRERQIDEQRPLADEETGRRSLRASESEDVPSDVSEESTVLPLPRFNPCVLLRRVSGERDNQRERQIDEQRPLADEETGRRSLRASESEDVPSDVSEESTVLPLPRFNPCVLLQRVSGERDNQRERQIDEQRPLADEETGRRSLRASESEDVPSDVSEESTVLPLPRFNPCVLLRRVSGERDNQRERQIDEQRPLADEETGRRSLRASESEDVPSDVSEESTVLPLPRFNPNVLLRRLAGERDNHIRIHTFTYTPERERQIYEQRPLADEDKPPTSGESSRATISPQLVRMRTGVPQECGIESPERLRDDGCALSELQHACSKRLCATVQQEQEAYVINHPETLAGMTLIVTEMIKLGTRKDILTHVASYFMQPIQELDLKIRQLLKSPSRGSYLSKDRQTFDYVDHFLAYDIKRIMDELFPSKLPDIPTLPSSISNTTSSSFISIISSASTPKTPEKVPTPEPTWEQVIHGMVSGAVEKAMLAKVTDAHILYDAAYVELSKAVELAMEVPVIEIREDIAELYNGAYKQFEVIVEEIERIAAEILWEKRMRKKYKRTWRRQINFRGYLSPPTPKSYVSSHASYKVPPQPPCECQPQWTFNRYPKDRFGIYLPRDEEFDSNNVTSTPLMSNANLTDAEE